ncbi:hypothetical protein RRG08_050832 [Elysia crispata]|uniref:Uncharacterized protein n=1 Tax=Elysia crispata TaxID=231223 RepID=A0AAE1ADG0_9GAST|nr:hypothetical protein RRG08_050832 [Elysia crispata]
MVTQNRGHVLQYLKFLSTLTRPCNNVRAQLTNAIRSDHDILFSQAASLDILISWQHQGFHPTMPPGTARASLTKADLRVHIEHNVNFLSSVLCMTHEASPRQRGAAVSPRAQVNRLCRQSQQSALSEAQSTRQIDTTPSDVVVVSDSYRAVSGAADSLLRLVIRMSRDSPGAAMIVPGHPLTPLCGKRPASGLHLAVNLSN